MSLRILAYLAFVLLAFALAGAIDLREDERLAERHAVYVQASE